MITFFTTAKPFIGENKINQLNALRSWKQFSPSCEIIVFDKLIGAEEIINELSIINILDIEKFSVDIPLPLVNDMFYKAELIAKNPICCYLNADIILPENFLEIVLNIHHKLKSNYLLVGQRYDVEIESELAFNQDWEREFLNQNRNKMTLHPPSGSDFFIFPKNQYRKEDIPSLVIGRPGWDNWFIYNGVINKTRVIEISNNIIVYHQNHNIAYRSDKSRDSATSHNLNLMPVNEIYGYFLDQSNYYIINNKVKKRRNRNRLIYIKSLINRGIRLIEKQFKLNSNSR
jgi:hypothetical protein